MDGRGSNPIAGVGDGGRRGGTEGGAATNTTAAANDLGIVDDGNIDNVWNHGLRVGGGFKCRYCYWTKKGGGATRLREHLGGISRNVISCNVLPPDVRDAMRIAIRKGKQKRRDAKERKLRIEDELMDGVDRRAQVDDDDLQRALATSMRDLHFRQGLEGRSGTVDHGSASGSGSGSGAASCAGNSGRIGMMFRKAEATSRVYDADVSRSRTSTQARVDTLFSKTAHEDIGKAWARWFHANDIPGKKADCPYFRGAMKLTQQLSKGAHIIT